MPMSCEKIIFLGCLGVLSMTLLLSRFLLIPIMCQYVFYTFPLIYLGSHLSLKQNEIDEATGEKNGFAESMGKKDAMMFPVFGSATLLVLYVAYKFLDPWWVNCILTFYLTFLGIVALGETFSAGGNSLCESLSKEELAKDNVITITIRCWPFADKENPLTISITMVHIMSYLLATIFGILWIITKSFQLHNLFAIAFCIQAISIVNVGDFRVATLLLCGLFVYDIFWVFGTDVMITVAKNFEAPVKIIFPVSIDPWKQSILGLGDIVIPGIFLSMCLRFDNWLHRENIKNANNYHSKSVSDKKAYDIRECKDIDIHNKFSKFYFWVVIISYELGLITTAIIMKAFQHAQPALLYLVPSCLFSLFGAAALNGQVKEVMIYSEESVKGETGADSSGAAKSSDAKKSD